MVNKQRVAALFAGMVLVMAVFVGCQRGDFKVEPVMNGQPAPFDGYTISPEIYAEEGEPVIGTGVHVYVKGLDPNDLLE